MSTEIATLPSTTAAPFRSAALNLNLRQKSFVDHYLEVKVGWKAAQLAGYDGERNTLMSIATENLRKPAIKAYYEEKLSELAISSSEVLAELGDMARFDVKNAGKDAPIRAVDKLKALELAGKYHKLFTERVESESVLAPADIARLGESLLTAMMDAAQRMREAQAEQVLPPASMDQLGQVAGEIDHVGQPVTAPTTATDDDDG